MKNFLFLTVGLIFILAGSLAVRYFFMLDRNESSNYVPASQTETYPPNTSKNTQPASSGLQVQGTTSNRQGQNQLPTPDSFGVYEQFSTDQSTRYIDVIAGTGKEAVRGSTVALFYKGWLTNGILFDQSRPNEQGQVEPFVFQLGAGQVIPGWEQGIDGMREGGKRRLIIPSDLGYGPMGQGPIPANSMLIFDVELVGVQKP